MRRFSNFIGPIGIVTLIGLLTLTEPPIGPSSYVRAQVQNLENLEGKVIPFGKDGIEVLTHGPVHESFAQPGTASGPAVIVRKQPPEPVPELPPDQKPEGTNVVWISGYWAWDDDREDFLWVSGAWRAEPPNRDWVPGYWEEAEGGWRWVSGYWGIENQTTVELVPEPPEPIAEAVAAERADAVYVPGVWVYREQRYLWRGGFWLPHRIGWNWVHATYVWTPGGYCFVDGYWDYDWHRRGLLFAPVYFPRRYDAGWYYRPYFAIQTDNFFAALFVRPRYNHYYFGDYYDARYARSGFTPWVDYRVYGRWQDPSWDYYRWRYRNEPRWEQDLRGTYATRRQNESARPPRTWAEQERLVGGVSAKAPVLVRPIDKLQTASVKLQPVSKTEVKQIQNTNIQIQTLVKQRAKVEQQARVKGATGANQAAVKVELAKPKGRQPRVVDQDAPPPPMAPKLSAAPPPPKKAPAGKDKDDPPPPKKIEKKPPPDSKPVPPKKTPGGKDDPPPPKTPPKVEKKPPDVKPAPVPPPKGKKETGDPDYVPRPLPKPPPKVEKKSPDSQPPAPPKKKDKKDDPAGEAAGRTSDRIATILTRSTLRERGAHFPEDPQVTRSPVRQC